MQIVQIDANGCKCDSPARVCSKNRKVRAKVDSKMLYIGKLLLMGSWFHACANVLL